jgi:anti-sigma factor RsiW
MSLLDKTNCPGEYKLLSYIEGQLSFFGRLRLEKHLASCSECRELLGLMVRIERDQAELPTITTSACQCRAELSDRAASLRPLIEKDEHIYAKEAARAGSGPHTSRLLLAAITILGFVAQQLTG